jgi:hypothetical protein
LSGGDDNRRNPEGVLAGRRACCLVLRHSHRR